MIEHVRTIDIPDADQGLPVPVWMFNARIIEINQAIDQINFHLFEYGPTDPPKGCC